MDLQTMSLLGISVRRPWVDHPYIDRGQYVNNYRRANQYSNLSGWSSMVAPGNLPASHFGGMLRTRDKKKKKKGKLDEVDP